MKNYIKNNKSFIAVSVLVVALFLIPALRVNAGSPYDGCGIESLRISPSTTTADTAQITTITKINSDCVTGTFKVYSTSWSGGNFVSAGNNYGSDTNTETWNVNNTSAGTYTFTVKAVGGDSKSINLTVTPADCANSMTTYYVNNTTGGGTDEYGDTQCVQTSCASSCVGENWSPKGQDYPDGNMTAKCPGFFTACGAPSSAVSTIKVTSTNSQTSTPVLAQWDLVKGGATDICVNGLINGVPCTGTVQTYLNQTAGVTYTILPTNPRPDLYALNSVKLVSPVNRDGSMLALLKKIFAPTAEAYTVGGGAAQTPNSGGLAEFDVKWDPIANMGLDDANGVATTSISLSAQANSATSGQVQVVNTGAPGSTLTWTASSNAAWLSPSPASDSTGITNDSAGDYGSDTVTVNASGLAAGTYTGTVTFTGNSSLGQWSRKIYLTVNLTVTTQQCPNGDAYSNSSCTPCSNGGCTGTGGTPTNPVGSLSCNNGANNPPVCTISAPTATLSASPATINQGQSTTLTWGSTNATNCTGTGFTAGGTSGSRSTGALNTPGAQNYQVVCSGPGGNSSPAFATVTVLSPNASISASPARVSSGGSSTITWSSSQVNSCVVSGPGLSSTSKSGSQAVTVNSQATYTITCQTAGSPITESTTINIVPLFQEF
jgi:hypothetical protein